MPKYLRKYHLCKPDTSIMGVSIPVALIKELDLFLTTSGSWYPSRSEFIREALRVWVGEKYPLQPDRRFARLKQVDFRANF